MNLKRDQDDTWMRAALALGRRGHGTVWPNPAVGCVIVQQGRVVGRGWTQPSGRPHAETMALAQAGVRSVGATAYVTLEPCSHTGATGPCAQALIEAGISRVVVALGDPDPRVSGRGLAMLRAAGLEVELGCLAEQAARDHMGFLLRITKNRPMVTLKLAASFDGRIATASGHSQWITGAEARRAVHAMRARHDGVLVGGGTARADDPSLTVRGLGIAHQPVRIVAATGLDVAHDGHLARTARDVPVWMCHAEGADGAAFWEGCGAQLVPCRRAEKGLDPVDLLAKLGEAGLTRVFCEGGGQLAASLLTADCVDQIVGYTAGLAIGGDGLASLGAFGLERVDVAPRFVLRSSRQIGADLEHIWVRPAVS